MIPAIKPMPHLAMILKQRTHRDLELIARAHGLPFTQREPKAQGLAALALAYSYLTPKSPLQQRNLNSNV